MKVKELMNLLENFDPESEVVMSSDPDYERNSDISPIFSPLDILSTGFYIPDSSWSGDFIQAEHVEEVGDDYESAICLWPIN